jgi:predicted ArsR family transcriptional regulator
LEQPEALMRNQLITGSLAGSGQKIYALLSSDDPLPIDDIVEWTGLNSSGVLATLLDLDRKGFVRQLPGKTVQQDRIGRSARKLLIVPRDQNGISKRSSKLTESNALRRISKRGVKHSRDFLHLHVS